MDKDALKLGGILGAIALCVALLLSVANAATKDIIQERAEADEMAALSAVMPEAENFEESEDGLYKALKGDEPVGYCVRTTSPGYGGDISMIVGVSGGKVTGVSITSMEETPGLGAKAANESYTNQYIGKSGKIALSKNGGDIEAISGATITSRAVTEGVNFALEAAAKAEGGNENGK